MSSAAVKTAPGNFERGEGRGCRCVVCQPETGQRHAREAGAEFLQRPAARDRLGQVLGEFIDWLFILFLSFA